MLVAGIIAAAAVGQWVAAPQGNCPPGSTAVGKQGPEEFLLRRCMQDTEELTPATEDDLASKQFLCQPALENFQCCVAVYGTYENDDGVQDVGELRCIATPQGIFIGDSEQPTCPSTEITPAPNFSPDPQVQSATVWCGDTTTTSTNLEPAAIAAIVVTPLLLIAAAAGTAL